MSKTQSVLKCQPGECPENRCPFILTTGANKGLCCSERAYPSGEHEGTRFCRKHFNKMTIGKIRKPKKQIEKELNEEIKPQVQIDVQEEARRILNIDSEAPQVTNTSQKPPQSYQPLPTVKVERRPQPLDLSRSVAIKRSKPIQLPSEESVEESSDAMDDDSYSESESDSFELPVKQPVKSEPKKVEQPKPEQAKKTTTLTGWLYG